MRLNKRIFLYAAAAAIMAACSSNDAIVEQMQQKQAQLEAGAVGFDVYTQRGVTRAGQAGPLTLDNLKLAPSAGGGIGVFAYYTDNNDYEQSRIPDFMYNQLVEYKGNIWSYEPIKYWPNEYGDKAISDDADKVTFFAYAPYVATNTNGKILKSTGSDEDKWGITGMSRNSNQGDPIVKYIASFEAGKSVDLLWGVCDNNNWDLIQTGGDQNINDGVKGLPWLNVQRPKEAKTQADASQRVKFTFKHALTQLSFNIDAIVDEITKGNNQLAANTNIYVRQISFTGVALKGALNLNNEVANTAKWLDYDGIADIESGTPITLYDGLKDGKEGTAGAKASNEKTIGLNPQVISNEDNKSIDGVKPLGVTNNAVPLFAADPVMLIPTGEDMEIEIVYDVETKDEKLPTLLSDGKTHGSSIENRIKKTVSFGDYNISTGLESGKHYTFNLHLGMNSVKFDVAGISEWVETGTTIDVDLPSNGGETVGSTANAANTDASSFAAFSVGNAAQKYNFKITGLNPGESVHTALVGSLVDAIQGLTTADYTVGSAQDSNDKKADGAGNVFVSVKLPDNATVHNLPARNYLLIEGETSLRGFKAQFNQSAAAFGLQVNALANDGDNDKITIAATNNAITDKTNAIAAGALTTSDMKFGWLTDETGDALKVKVGGTDLTYDSSTPAADKFTYANGVITIGKHLVPGDVVEISVQATGTDGSLETGTKETVSFTVGGIYYAAGASQTIKVSSTAQDPLAPTLVGAGTLAYSKLGSSDAFTIVGNKITASKALVAGGVADVKCDLTAENEAGGAYFYTASSKTASYDLVINKQTTTTAFANETLVMSGQTKDANSDVTYTNDVTVTAEDGSAISTPSVTYLIVSVTKNNASVSNDTFAITSDGTLKVGASALEAGGTYDIVIKASYASTESYESSEAEFTLSVTAKGN